MKIKAFKAALPYTLPICVGFLFLGMSYGFLMRSKGFSVWYPLFMSMFIFAGSMEFVTVNLLLSAFHPLSAFLLALMVNARHLFYGISMLDKYEHTGWKKFYLIYGMCDESFSINCTVTPPEDVDKGWFMFFVTLLNHLYWVCGATAGALLGYVIHFDTTGISDKKNKEDNWVENLSLSEAMKRLTPREHHIIDLRFFEGKTQMEVAEEIHISQAQVSRLEKNALKTMRNYLK